MSVIKATNLCDVRCLFSEFLLSVVPTLACPSQTGCRFRVIFRRQKLDMKQQQLGELTRNSTSTQHEVMVRRRV